jgi:hypothetical protein
MNPSNSSNSINAINFLTVDLEDYFQVQAFSDVVEFEDWGNYESRIERNTHRLLNILNQCSASNPQPQPSNGFQCASVPSPNDSKPLPHTSNLKPQTSLRATFFCLGWVAERYPRLIKEIKDRGHEVACHGYAHKLIYNQSKDEFREDIKKAKAILEDVSGDEVIGYRAPSYSITQESKWALEILMEEGFKYDSSIFPIHHDFYGFPQAPRFPFLISTNGNNNFEFSTLNFALRQTQSSVLSPSHSVLSPHHSVQSSVNSINPSNSTNSSNPTTPNSSLNSEDFASNLKRPAETKPFGEGWSAPLTSSKLIEFPISTLRICGQNIPISGGGYFRLFPYSLVKKGLERINWMEGMPFIFYLHPWEIDPYQPRINSISRKSRFRHYVNLHKTENRFKRLLRDFNFSSIKEVIELKNSIIQELNEPQYCST